MSNAKTELSLSQTVPASLAGHRLDQAMARMFPEYSRSRLKEWILQGQVLVDGAARKPRDPMGGGELIELTAVAEPAVVSLPEPVELQSVFEDDHLLIINKPSGLVVHPGAGNTRGTLMNGLLYRVPRLVELPRAGIVHRLDKDTSGLLLVAKTLTAHTALVRRLADRAVSRHYIAVCNGALTGGGRIDEPIGRHPVDRRKMAVRESGKPAVTHYRVIRRFRAHTYISVELETGRTHQIRVHMAYRRHPLVGDATYGGRLALPRGASEMLIETLRKFRRQALHAHRLVFAHPVSELPVDVSVDPPADFRQLLEVLGADSDASGA
ncbi:MAG: 23S rRNA pseudouridine(1911/1915/1917) synthase RluD [Gammaproteobacteria bacterium]|nr:23S rRNA pseudouridine(1911/1915/1917) synthase RluD [Gammaproteobacteria bacterium]MDH4316211.1 23S rRNA pseudouridine(1911/1915/1917) synthase RluD [Gammaproteobacteria bacterium]MDH5215575.1 23S rRNA pseudouridine(1911/1915/1917) synthase RluD [Gammaproteobacteria bacterium]MDH5500221.1 23S rRNA pseudouridine(1911/1915/1917) synthase RluD [Gammaproteobacteria bacterium]